MDILLQSNNADRRPASGPARFCFAWISCLLLVVSNGCQVFQRFRQPSESAPIVLPQSGTATQILEKVNEQSRRIRQLKTDVRIAVDGMPGLRGDLLLERPDRLRLKAGLMGMSEMGFDVGTNPELFWIWKKAATLGDPPAIYYAYHEEFQHSALHQQLPLQPKWLLEGMGLVELTNDVQGTRTRTDGRLEVVSRRAQDPHGPMRVSVIDPKRGLVLRQSFYDVNGKLLAYVDSSKHRYYQEHRVSLPQHIEIHVFDSQGRPGKMVVDCGEFSINALFGDPAMLWTMPNPPDVSQVNLSKVGTERESVESEAATQVSRNWDTFSR